MLFVRFVGLILSVVIRCLILGIWRVCFGCLRFCMIRVLFMRVIVFCFIVGVMRCFCLCMSCVWMMMCIRCDRICWLW